FLTEINVTSPTCLREIEAAASPGIASQLMDCIAAEWSKLGR
ncbi:MAG: glutathione synthase, partial [Luminiphilus sp.]